MNEKKKDILDFAKIAAKNKYIVAAIALGLLLISFPSGEKEKKEATDFRTAFDTEAFERRIEKVLSGCEGVGRCEVILSVESGPESVYAEESRKSRKEQETFTESDSDTKPSITSEGSGKEKPVLVKELYPEFRGAVVVCDGAESAELRKKVVEAVSALTKLGTDRISIIKMKK